MNDIQETLGILFFLLGILVLVLLLTLGISYTSEVIECYGFENATGINAKMGGMTCYANVEGKWVPKDFVFGSAHDIRINNGK